jgi:hypothetical protein
MFIDCRTEHTARASDPATGDVVIVGRDITSDRMVYRLNGGPLQDVPRRILAINTYPLYKHVVQCQVTDNEELTLPSEQLKRSLPSTGCCNPTGWGGWRTEPD